MGHCSSSYAVNDSDDIEGPVFRLQNCDIVVNSAGEYILAATSAIAGEENVIDTTRKRFEMAYNTFVATRSFKSDAEIYVYARCILNAHRVNAEFVDAELDSLQDGIYRPFIESLHRTSSGPL